MLLAYALPNGKQEVHQLKNFVLIPKALPKLLTSSSDVLILSALLSFHRRSKKVFPSFKTLMQMCGIKSLRTVNYAIERLRAAGIIETSKRHGRNSLSFKFLWCDVWAACLRSKKPTKLTVGQQFNPDDMFQSYPLHTATLGSQTVSPSAKILLAYMMERVGDNCAAWPTFDEIGADLGIGSRATITKLIKELESIGLILANRRSVRQKGSPANSYTLLFSNIFSEDIVKVSEDVKVPDVLLECKNKTASEFGSHSAQGKYTSCIPSVHFLQPVNNPIEVPRENQENGRLTSSVLPSSHYNDLGTEAVVVIENKEGAVEAFVDSLPESPLKDKLMDSLGQITSKVDAAARLKMALQMVMTKGIKNKAAYLTSLILKYMRGEYKIDGLELMQRDFSRRAKSEHAQYYIHDDVREL